MLKVKTLTLWLSFIVAVIAILNQFSSIIFRLSFYHYFHPQGKFKLIAGVPDSVINHYGFYLSLFVFAFVASLLAAPIVFTCTSKKVFQQIRNSNEKKRSAALLTFMLLTSLVLVSSVIPIPMSGPIFLSGMALCLTFGIWIIYKRDFPLSSYFNLTLGYFLYLSLALLAVGYLSQVINSNYENEIYSRLVASFLISVLSLGILFYSRRGDLKCATVSISLGISLMIYSQFSFFEESTVRLLGKSWVDQITVDSTAETKTQKTSR